jgi:ribosomal-protein-alanine N-acetyltransferase
MTEAGDRFAGIPAISTARLQLQAVLPREYEILAFDRSDPALWIDRGFTNPHGYLHADPGPLPYRLPQIREHPERAAYLLRMAVHRESATIIGSAGFHGLPDVNGMIEIGVEIVPQWRGQGFAQEVLHGMWGWVLDQPNVRVLRYTVSPDNRPSQSIIRKFGFQFKGQQLDPKDGPEDIFEMDAVEYRRRLDHELLDSGP